MNEIDAINKIDEELKNLNKELLKSDEIIIKISKDARELVGDFASLKLPNDVDKQLTHSAALMKDLNSEIDKQAKRQKELEDIIQKLLETKTKNNKKTAEEIVNQRVVNQNLQNAAKVSSALYTEYQKLSILLNTLIKRKQDLAVKQELGNKLTKAEQAEYRQLTADINKYDATLKKVDASVGRFQRNVGNYQKGMMSAASAARSLASAMGMVGGAYLFVQVMRDAFNTIVEFDKQLIAVQKTTNMTDKEMSAFKEEVIQLGLELKGVSIQGLLKAAEVAGQLGIKGSANILKFSKTIEQLKLTSDIASDESVRAFAQFIEVSKDSVENADRLGSVITELGNNFATTESQILNNATEIQKGLSLYEASAQGVLGLGAATSALGNEAEVSAGALQKAFGVLNQGAATGKNLEKILKLTGQTAEEFREEFGRDAVSTFQKFIKGMKDAEAEGANLTVMFKELGMSDLRVTRVIGSLTKNYDTLADSIKRANEEYIANEALTNEAANSARSLSSQLGDLGDEWDGFVLSLEDGSGAISKALTSVLGFVTEIIKGIKLLNSSADEYSAGLSKDIDAKTYNEVKKAYAEMGDSAEALAIREADAARDKVDSITAEIKRLQEESKKATDEAIGWGRSFTEAINDKKIEELSRDLGYYNGVLKASEEIITQTVSTTKELTAAEREALRLEKEAEAEKKKNNKTKKEKLAALKGSIGYYNELIRKLTQEQERVSTSNEIWRSYEEKINAAREAIRLLKGEMLNKDSVMFGEGTNVIDSKINDIVLGFYSFQLSEEERLKRESNARKLQQDELYARKRKEIEAGIVSSIIDLTNAIFDAKVMRIDEEIQINRDKYAAILDNENLTEQERSAIEAQRDRKERELEKKKREEQRKAAIFNKIISLGTVAIQTATAISAAYAPPPVGLGPVLGSTLLPLIIAQGALQAASIIAAPIPRYKTGRKGGKAELAYTGDGYVNEYIEKKDGTIIMTPNVPTLTWLDSGDKVHKNQDALLKEKGYDELYEILYKHGIMSSVNHNKEFVYVNELGRLSNNFKQSSDKMIDAISKKKHSTTIHQTINLSDDISYLLKGQF